MRAQGSTALAGPSNEAFPALPREPRESREEARARIEAKRARQAASRPWANRTPPTAEEVREARREGLVDPEVVEQFAEPVPVDLVDEDRETLPPKPAPRPRAAAPARAVPSGVDAAGIVRDYVEDGLTVNAIAKARGHSGRTVRDVLLSTPGVTMRDDRSTNSGGAASPVDPEQAEQVRTLYVDEGLTRAQVAERLGVSQKVVTTVMRKAGIKARPPANRAPVPVPLERNAAHRIREQLEAAGVTAADVRTWAAGAGLEVSPTGSPRREVVDAYLRAHGLADPAPDQKPVTAPPTPAAPMLTEAPAPAPAPEPARVAQPKPTVNSRLTVEAVAESIAEGQARSPFTSEPVRALAALVPQVAAIIHEHDDTADRLLAELRAALTAVRDGAAAALEGLG